jgi:hypothetical protein
MFEATHDPGQCTFCRGAATPAFINGSTDALERLQRICAACVASFIGVIGFVPTEDVELTREALKIANGDLARVSNELDAAGKRADALEAELARERVAREAAEYQAKGLQTAFSEKKRYADELESGSVPLAALRKEIADALTRATVEPKATTKTKEPANV